MPPKLRKQPKKPPEPSAVSRARSAGSKRQRFSGTVTDATPVTDPTQRRLKEAESSLRRAARR